MKFVEFDEETPRETARFRETADFVEVLRDDCCTHYCVEAH